MQKDTVTLKIDENTFNQMMTSYKKYQEANSGEYIALFARLSDDLTCTLYRSNKGYTALFSGFNALEEAQKWNKNAVINIPKQKVKSEWLDIDSQIGSDEVGTGDFFGPVIVVASYIPKEMIPFLKELNVDDSKKLTDDKILQIVPQFIDKVVFSRLICHPQKYNEMINKGYSMNAIKSILHNQALTNVREKIGSTDMKCYVDQFTPVDSYYKDLFVGGYKPLTNNIVFETKGESHYPSVAVSSMIARYTFLNIFEEYKNKYGVIIPKGASLKVDDVALLIKNKYGINEINSLVKTNFKNYEKIK